MSNSWRDIARPIIQKILKDNKSEGEIRRALFDAYPFGERKYWPYKVWLDEIKRQRGLKKQTKDFIPENQTDLFNG